jgi:hypothetical protein
MNLDELETLACMDEAGDCYLTQVPGDAILALIACVRAADAMLRTTIDRPLSPEHMAAKRVYDTARAKLDALS